MITTAIPYIKNVVKKIEKYTGYTYGSENGSEKEDKPLDLFGLVWLCVNLGLLIFALYLSFKRNAGFNFGSFLMACCCYPCYIAYALAIPVSQTTYIVPGIAPSAAAVTAPGVAAATAPGVATATAPGVAAAN